MKFKRNPFHNQIRFEEKTLKNGRKYTIREDRSRYLYPDEWKAVFDELKEKQKPTFIFLINTGARINEARNVLVQDVDFERLNIVFRVTKSRNKDGSRRIRTIPISPQFVKYLGGLIRKKNLQMTDKFPILSTPAANIGLRKAVIKAGIPDYQMISIHNIRKTFEMWLRALGVEDGKVAQHQGHSLMIAMKHYTSVEIFNWQDKDEMRQILGDLYRKS